MPTKQRPSKVKVRSTKRALLQKRRRQREKEIACLLKECIGDIINADNDCGSSENMENNDSVNFGPPRSSPFIEQHFKSFHAPSVCDITSQLPTLPSISNINFSTFTKSHSRDFSLNTEESISPIPGPSHATNLPTSDSEISSSKEAIVSSDEDTKKSKEDDEYER